MTVTLVYMLSETEVNVCKKNLSFPLLASSLCKIVIFFSKLHGKEQAKYDMKTQTVYSSVLDLGDLIVLCGIRDGVAVRNCCVLSSTSRQEVQYVQGW